MARFFLFFPLTRVLYEKTRLVGIFYFLSYSEYVRILFQRLPLRDSPVTNIGIILRVKYNDNVTLLKKHFIHDAYIRYALAIRRISRYLVFTMIFYFLVLFLYFFFFFFSFFLFFFNRFHVTFAMSRYHSMPMYTSNCRTLDVTC